ncbi:DUF4232 domain-containing protein [Streptomyces sp. NPDC102274]|uniref:DUF4232 domain-containing protein n=1 Tax=Streptomyces sp. NPDC102274 TaxID=3366151 RepID=UPI00381A3937
MRVHKLTFAALAVVASLSLTACNEEDLVGQGAPSAASTASPSAAGSDQGGGKESAGTDSTGNSSGGQGTAAGTGSNENGEVGKCRTDDLDITAADSTIDGDTEGTVAVELKNGGGRDCVLSAYAGVDLKTSSGTLSAERTGQQADSSILKDGESTFFGINYPINESGGSGVRVTGLVVTPPDETKSFSLEWPGSATLPASDGSGSPVKVGPIGSAGQGGQS